MSVALKFYVVWVGRRPGIYGSWPECLEQTRGFAGGRFKAYRTLEEAMTAYSNGPVQSERATVVDGKTPVTVTEAAATWAVARVKPPITTRDGMTMSEALCKSSQSADTRPPVTSSGGKYLTVDGACSVPAGIGECRGVLMPEGVEVFRMGPFYGATNNLMEYVAAVVGLHWCVYKGVPGMPVYTDSTVAMSWVLKYGRCSVPTTSMPPKLREAIEAVNGWLVDADSRVLCNLRKWETARLGEIPADFGRKK